MKFLSFIILLNLSFNGIPKDISLRLDLNKLYFKLIILYSLVILKKPKNMKIIDMKKNTFFLFDEL